MKLAIMQPYFFPYIGYFSLINYSDKWIVFDDIQFIRHGWIERNRILSSSGDWIYIKVPLKKHKRGTNILNIEIRNDENWKKKFLDQLTFYKKKAPFYNNVINLVNNIFERNFNNISSFNVYSLVKICRYIGIEFNYQLYSDLEFDVRNEIDHPGQWALLISQQLSANEYVNPINGRNLFIKKEFQDFNIKLKFLENNLKSYSQNNQNFIKGLSIIDVLMFNEPKDVLELINNYKISN